MDAIKTYVIPEPNMARLQDRLEKLNKRACRLGLPEVGVDVVETEERVYVRESMGVEDLDDKYRPVREGETLAPDAITTTRVFKHVVIVGTHPHYAGWSFVATLQHLVDDEGQAINLLRTVPSFEGVLPEQYRTADASNCDHCHKRIQTRKETFVVRHDDGTWKQIGRQCCQDFLGGVNPQAIAAALEHLFGVVAACEEGMGGGFGSAHGGGVDTVTLLTYTAACIRVDGWMSRGRARALNEASPSSHQNATVDDVAYILNPPQKRDQKYREWVGARRPTQADRDLAAATRTYVVDTMGAQEPLSDYEYNLVTALRLSTVPPRGDGLVASAVAAYQRHIEQEHARVLDSERTRNSVYVGTMGAKVTVQATLLKVIRTESQWGITRIHKFVTTDGNALTWFCTGDAMAPVAAPNPTPEQPYEWTDLVVGQTYALRGTVKAQLEYKGVKQTVLSRCTFPTPEVLAAEAAKAKRKAAREAKKAAKALKEVA